MLIWSQPHASSSGLSLNRNDNKRLPSPVATELLLCRIRQDPKEKIEQCPKSQIASGLVLLYPHLADECEACASSVLLYALPKCCIAVIGFRSSTVRLRVVNTLSLKDVESSISWWALAGAEKAMRNRTSLQPTPCHLSQNAMSLIYLLPS